MIILYFTATGNGLYLAKKIGGRLIPIPKAIKNDNYHFSDDKIGIIFPIYGLAVPPYIGEFLQKLHLDSAYIFAVMSYGMTRGAAANYLSELASECGIHFSYINTIKMVDNYLPNFDMEKQKENEPKKQIDKHLNSIIDDINNCKHRIPKDSFLSKFMTEIFLKSYKFKTGVGVTKDYSIENTCIKCGICEKVCPVDNIKVNGAKPVFDSKCISCLSCTHNCPQNSIRLEGEKSKSRFRNQNISIKEIIDSNE